MSPTIFFIRVSPLDGVTPGAIRRPPPSNATVYRPTRLWQLRACDGLKQLAKSPLGISSFVRQEFNVI